MDLTQITYLDIDLWAAHYARTGKSLHVLIDDKDVTTRCFRAIRHVDRRHGDVFLYRVNEAGDKYLGADHKVATEVLTGVLTIGHGGPLR